LPITVVILNSPRDDNLPALPLMLADKLGGGYQKITTVAFTAASNDFELAIAVAVAIFETASGQALATVVGPPLEVPVQISLVNVTLWLRRSFFSHEVPGMQA
jgi:ACR3 family arsenite transporter